MFLGPTILISMVRKFEPAWQMMKNTSQSDPSSGAQPANPRSRGPLTQCPSDAGVTTIETRDGAQSKLLIHKNYKSYKLSLGWFLCYKTYWWCSWKLDVGCCPKKHRKVGLLHHCLENETESQILKSQVKFKTSTCNISSDFLTVEDSGQWRATERNG